MRSTAIFLLLLLVPPFNSLGELPEDNDDVINEEFPETLTSSSDSDSDVPLEDVTAVESEDGPTPPSVVSAPLDPLPAMSVPLARPPGFGPPPSFKQRKDSGEHAAEHVDVGFVVRRGRTRVMGFSRRKTD